MNDTISRIGMGWFALVALVAVGIAQPAGAQDSAKDEGLIPLIPPKSLVFIERRGHAEIKPAFDASNLGKMVRDKAVNQFVHKSRVAVGKMILRGLYGGMDSPEELTKYHAQLHEMLKPFWHDPAIMFIAPSPKKIRSVHDIFSSPNLGFVCAVGAKNFKTCKAALEFFTRAGAVNPGKNGTRHTFTYTSKNITWHGVLKRDMEFVLSGKGKADSPAPDQPATADELKNGSVFMYTWRHRLLYVSFSMPATEAITETMSKPDGKIAPNVRAVLNKTRMKDWAFRWYVNVDGFRGPAKKQKKETRTPTIAGMLGVNKIRGVGGVGGYIDKVYARRTYIDAPGTAGGLLKLLKPDGSYKKALAMVPLDSTFLLAGQLDTAQADKLARMVCMSIASDGPVLPDAKLTDDQQKEMDKKYLPVRKLIAASNGNIAFYAGDIQAFMTGSFPCGVVLDIKDRAKAAEAIDELLKVAGIQEPKPAAAAPAGNAADPSAAKPAKPVKPAYRDVPIRKFSERMLLALLKDRVILGCSDNGIRAAIDAALDEAGGFDKDSKGAKILKKCPAGPMVFAMDLPALTKLFWPMLISLTQMAPEDSTFPLVALPSTQKIVRMLGPEIVIITPDADGLLLDGRGKIPFVTKIIPAYPAMMLGFMMRW